MKNSHYKTYEVNLLNLLLLPLALALVLIFVIIPNVLAGEVAEIQRAIQSKGVQWVAGETSMTRLPSGERMKRAGLVALKISGKEKLLSPKAMALPPYLDWRDNGGTFVTPVKDQGSCASCWAFSATAALESVTLIANRTPNADLDLSEQALLSCSGAGNCEVGGYVDGASDYLRDTGLPAETCDPYTAGDGNCVRVCPKWKTSTYKISSWDWVATTAPTAEGIKNALFSKGPLVSTMVIYDDFYAYTSGSYQYTTGNPVGNHAVLIVGYDDIGHYFIVKNSWGTGWGESGYFRIAYSEVNTVVSFGYYTIAYTGSAPACSSFVSQSFGSEGGTGSVRVSVPGGCSWNATSNNSWITISSGRSGAGDGMVGFSVSANEGTASRSSSMTIAGQIYTITQEGQPCGATLSPAIQSFLSTGGNAVVNVTVAGGCSWTATSNVNWITITSGASGSGSGTVGYSVTSNTGPTTRTGTLSIEGNAFTVTQSGSGGVPDINVSPVSYNFGYVTRYKSKSANITVTNSGTGPLTIDLITFEPRSIHYKQTNNCTAIEPGSSCTITAIFAPATAKLTLSTYLVVSSNDPDENTVKVLLQGKGTRY